MKPQQALALRAMASLLISGWRQNRPGRPPARPMTLWLTRCIRLRMFQEGFLLDADGNSFARLLRVFVFSTRE